MTLSLNDVSLKNQLKLNDDVDSLSFMFPQHSMLKLPDLSLGTEWALLELLTLGLSSADEQERFAELIQTKDLDWEELLTQASRHKILFLLAFHATSSPFKEAVPSTVQHHLRTALLVNRHKVAIYRQEVARIIQALNQQNIRFVVTKGMTLESTIYQGNGSRTFSDIDLMILPQSRTLVSQILSELGYEMGTFDGKTGTILPHSRKTLIGYQLNPDHLPSHMYLTDDPIIRFIELDVANSLTWTLSLFQVPIEVALAEIVYQSIPGNSEVQMPCFIPEFQFIFTILHLFKEAWVELTVSLGKDVTLSKFGDVVRLWNIYRNILQTEAFMGMLEELGMIEPMVWVLEHLDRTFHTGIVTALGLEGRVTEEWLLSAGAANGKVRRWRGTMRERLYCKNRQQLF